MRQRALILFLRRARVNEQRGSAIAEFTMVVGLLTLLALAVVQLGLALHIRNTIHDAAAEGARVAALAGATREDGAERTRQLISAGLNDSFAANVTVTHIDFAAVQSAEVRVITTLPLIGLFGVESGLEVTGHAALELQE